MKMAKKKIGETKIGKYKSHKHKNQIWKFSVDINKKLVYTKASLDNYYKYFMD